MPLNIDEGGIAKIGETFITKFANAPGCFLEKFALRRLRNIFGLGYPENPD